LVKASPSRRLYRQFGAHRIIGNADQIREIVGAGAPTDGTTGANVAGIGSRYTDVTNANLYINAGTRASPTWKLVTRAA
jgi:hypothetical protein